MAKDWIQGAIKKPGSLTAQAEKAGKSITDFCSSENLSAKAKKRCVLAKTLKGFNK